MQSDALYEKINLKGRGSINAINALIIPEADRYKLTAIVIKLHQLIPPNQSDRQYW